VQDGSLGNHLFYMILGLREYEKDIGNPTFDNFGQLPLLIESTA
jgi:hypothetical protein